MTTTQRRVVPKSHAGMVCPKCQGNVMLRDDTLSCIQCSTVIEYRIKFMSDSNGPYAETSAQKIIRRKTTPGKDNKMGEEIPAENPSQEAFATVEVSTAQEASNPAEEAEELATEAPQGEERPPFGLTTEEAKQTLSSHLTTLQWLTEKRWPNGPSCINCNSTRLVTQKHTKPPKYSCQDCRTEFPVLHATPMANTRTDLNRWMAVAYALLQNPSQPEHSLAHANSTSVPTVRKIRQALELSANAGLEMFEPHPEPPPETSAPAEPLGMDQLLERIGSHQEDLKKREEQLLEEVQQVRCNQQEAEEQMKALQRAIEIRDQWHTADQNRNARDPL